MTKMIKTVLAAICLTAAAPAFAQNADGPPAVGEPKSFTLPKLETYELSNGMNVTLVPYGRVPKATVRAVVQVGNLNDGGQPWIADLTADMMKEGAGGKSAADLALAAAGMGGDLNIGVGLDTTFAAMDVLSEKAPDAIALIADVVQSPNLPETELERVRSNILRNLSVASTQPGSIADDAFLRMMYPDHPYSNAVLPDPETVGGYGLADVKAFHAANFGGARTHLYVVGKFDRREVKAAIKDSFSGWTEGPAPLMQAPQTSIKDIKLIDRADAVQSTIRLGKRVPPLTAEMDMEAADTLLGGYFSSRITSNIREDKGYTYSPFSAVSAELGAAYWNQNADVTSESTGPALFEIVKEIEGLRNEPPSEEELQGVKNYMNGIYVIRLASRGGIANQLAFANLHGLGAEYLEGYVDEVTGLTPADVQNAAKTHLSVDDMSLVVVGPLDSVRGQLEDLAAFKGRLPE